MKKSQNRIDCLKGIHDIFVVSTSLWKWTRVLTNDDIGRHHACVLPFRKGFTPVNKSFMCPADTSVGHVCFQLTSRMDPRSPRSARLRHSFSEEHRRTASVLTSTRDSPKILHRATAP